MTEAVSQCFSRTQYNGYHRLEHRAKKQPLPLMGDGCFIYLRELLSRERARMVPPSLIRRKQNRRKYRLPLLSPYGRTASDRISHSRGSILRGRPTDRDRRARHEVRRKALRRQSRVPRSRRAVKLRPARPRDNRNRRAVLRPPVFR